MAINNPRNDVSFSDILVRDVTFKTDNSIVYDRMVKGETPQYGRAVKVVSSKTVGLATSGRIFGFAKIYDNDSRLAVQIQGTFRAKVASGNVTGGQYLVAAAGGAVAPSASSGTTESNFIALEDSVDGYVMGLFV